MRSLALLKGQGSERLLYYAEDFMNIKTFENLREYILGEKAHTMDCFIDKLDELNEFEQGMFKGEIITYDNILNLLHGIIKYGDGCNEGCSH